jgi:hypothetical protein
MKWLRERGADINVRDNEGRTPLSAAMRGYWPPLNGKAAKWPRANGAKE